MTELDGEEIGHVAPLGADTIPDGNQSHHCFACEEPMTGLYCAACGNKNDDMRRSIWSLGAELFSSLTAFEGRTFRSLRSLIFSPGKMARDYADGARQKWASPIRLYLAMSIMLFGYIALTSTQLVAFGPKLVEPPSSGEASETPELRPQAFFLERKSTVAKHMSNEAFSAFERELDAIIQDDSLRSEDDLIEEIERNKKNLENLEKAIAATTNDFAKSGMERGIQPLVERIARLESRLEERRNDAAQAEKVGETLQDMEGTPSPPTAVEDSEGNDDDKDETEFEVVNMRGQSFDLDAAGMRDVISVALRQPERVNAPINTYLPRIMFLLMPFSMLLGAIFIRGKEKALLYDHLVHSAYIHAFSFLLLLVFILLVQFTPLKGLIWVYMLILLIYLPLSAKAMFGRGWPKTIITSYGVGLLYTFVMSIILTTLLVSGLIDIASDISASRSTLSE